MLLEQRVLLGLGQVICSALSRAACFDTSIGAEFEAFTPRKARHCLSSDCAQDGHPQIHRCAATRHRI